MKILKKHRHKTMEILREKQWKYCENYENIIKKSGKKLEIWENYQFLKKHLKASTLLLKGEM